MFLRIFEYKSHEQNAKQLELSYMYFRYSLYLQLTLPLRGNILKLSTYKIVLRSCERFFPFIVSKVQQVTKYNECSNNFSHLKTKEK